MITEIPIIEKDIQNIILISDIHFGVRNASLEWIDNMSSYFYNFFFPLMEKIKKDAPNSAVIVAGDYFDNRQALDLNIMNIGIDIMKKMSSILPVYIINGNHDVYKKHDNGINSLTILSPIDNVNVITDPTVLKTKFHKFLLFPWSGDIKENNSNMLKFNDVDYAIMHEDIKSFRYDNGREIVSGFDLSLFKGTKIYSGHIHKRQESDKATYIGSPYQLRRSDVGNEKGIYVLNCENKKVSETFYQNDYSPKFLKLKLDFISELTLENIYKIVKNNYVDIYIPKEDFHKVNQGSLIEIMNKCQVKKIELIEDNSNIEKTEDNNESYKDMNIQDVVYNRIDSLDISEEQKVKLKSLNDKYIDAFNESQKL